MSEAAGHRIFTMSLALVYPLYLARLEKKALVGCGATCNQGATRGSVMAPQRASGRHASVRA